jgi:hypothetical protein
MLTGLDIKQDIKRSRMYNIWGQGHKAKSVFEAKKEICRKLQDYGCPPYNTNNVMVELPPKNMGDIARLIKKYKDTDFRNFDKALTVWMRQSEYDGKDDRGLWDRLTSAPRVGQQI